MGAGNMKVIINKKEVQMDRAMTVKELLQERGMKKAAVWINGQQLLRAEYDTRRIEEGDEIRLLRIMAGG